MDTKIYQYKMKVMPLVLSIAFGSFFILGGVFVATSSALGTVKIDGTLATAWDALYGALAWRKLS